MQIKNISFRQNPSESKPQDKKPEVKTSEEQGSSKLLLALGALAALGAGALLVHKLKPSEVKDAADAAKKATPEVKAPKAEPDAPEIKNTEPEKVEPKIIEEPEVYGPPRPPIVDLPPRSEEEIKAVVDKFLDISPKSKNALKRLGEKFDYRHSPHHILDKMPNGIGIFGADQKEIDATVALLPELTRSKLEIIKNTDKTPEEFWQELNEKRAEAEQHYKNTHQMTLLYLGDFAQTINKMGKDMPEVNAYAVTEGAGIFHHLMDHPDMTDGYRVVYSNKNKKSIPADVLAPYRTEMSLYTKTQDALAPQVLEAHQKAGAHLDAIEKDELLKFADNFDTISKYPYTQLLPNCHVNIPMHLGIIGPDEKESSAIIEQLSDLTGAKFQSLEAKGKTSYQHTAEIFKNLKKATENFQSTGERTLMHIGNIDEIIENVNKTTAKEPERKKLFKIFGRIIRNYNKEDGSTIVYSLKDPNKLPEELRALKSGAIKTNSNKPKKAQDALSAMTSVLDKNQKNNEQKLVMVYRAFNSNNEALLPNVFGVTGSDSAQIKTVIDNLSPLTQRKVETIDHENKSFKEFLAEVVKKRQEAKEHFKNTRETTIVYIGDAKKIYEKGLLEKVDGEPYTKEALDAKFSLLMGNSVSNHNITFVYSCEKEAEIPKAIEKESYNWVLKTLSDEPTA